MYSDDLFSHCVYVLRNYPLAPLPSLTELCISIFRTETLLWNNTSGGAPL